MSNFMETLRKVIYGTHVDVLSVWIEQDGWGFHIGSNTRTAREMHHVLYDLYLQIKSTYPKEFETITTDTPVSYSETFGSTTVDYDIVLREFYGYVLMDFFKENPYPGVDTFDESLKIVHMRACNYAIEVIRNTNSDDGNEQADTYTNSDYGKLIRALHTAYPEKMKAIVNSYKKQDSPS